MPRTYFLTTAIDYTNGSPHIGHAYEKVLADVLARYHRIAGETVYFLTGVDQHGQKVQQSAEKQGIAPQQFVDEVTARFVALWEKLGVHYDGWAATTDELHKTCVRGILTRLWEEGQLYKDKRAGYYSVRQEQFLTDKERGPDGEFGAEWGEVVLLEEENYYFKLAQHREWLLALIDSKESFVIPEFRRGELRNAVEKLAGDLCVSRPKSRLSWGIEFPFDPEFVTYVWFDALVNYISFCGYDPAQTTFASQPETFRARWPALHVIGKDILIPAHGIYWPIMLKALGFADTEMPQLLVHGWWNISGAKMSKSLGNVVDPAVLADTYGSAAVRYYLMSDIATGKDADFSEDRLVQTYNSQLANSLGNLLNRTLNMAAKYRSGKLQRPVRAKLAQALDAANPSAPLDLSEVAARSVEAYREAMAAHQVQAALAAAGQITTSANQYVDLTAPWKLAKDPAQAERLDAVLYSLAESLRVIAILLSPVLPQAAHGIFDQLNWKMEQTGEDGRILLSDAAWCGDSGLPDDHQLGAPTPLFPRFEPSPEKASV